MENIENIIRSVMFWGGISGIVLSAVAGFKKYVIDAPYYDNTGLLDDYKPKKAECYESKN